MAELPDSPAVSGTPTDFSVGEIVATALDSLLSAAALHLGEPLPSGRTLAERDPIEAYLALMAASALLDQLGPVMNDDVRLPFQAGLNNLARRFATQHPRAMVPKLDKPPVTSLQAAIKAAWDAIGASPSTQGKPQTGPLGRPGLGLPKSGTSPFGSGFLGKPGTGPLPGR